MRFATFAAALLLAWPAAAQAPIAGKAIALDGETLLVGEQKVRLWGVEAPEMKVWPWGPRARAALDHWLAVDNDGSVRCEPRDRDRDRVVARCFTKLRLSVEERDLGEWLIKWGFAVEYRTFSKGAYAAAECEALGQARGIWAAPLFGDTPYHPRPCEKR